MNTNARIEPFLNVYSPPRREKTRRWETSFRSLFTGQPSYLPELSGPQPLEDGRAETQNRLRAHQALSLVGYEPNHDELRYERKRHVSTPSRKKCGHPAEEREPHREFKASRRRQDRRSSTPQGKDSIEKTTRTVIDTVEEADDRRYASVLQSSIRSNHPHCIWLQSEELRRSTAVQRERRPQATTIVSLSAIGKFSQKPPIPHFFHSVCGCWRNRGSMLDDFRIETLH